MTFLDKLHRMRIENNSVLCVGIDPDPRKIPMSVSGSGVPDRVVRFCSTIIDATAPYASSFKLNFAFFEALGDSSVPVLRAVRNQIPDSIPVIADAKRGDIGNTAGFYVRSIFDDLKFDAVTVSPYMGRDSIVPFLENENTCTFVLAKTSNPGAADFQSVVCADTALYELVAERVRGWSSTTAGDAGLVVGAKDTQALAHLRELCPDMPFLIPGIGAQGGDPVSVMKAASSGPVIINSSRSILYASGGEDYATAAGNAADTLRMRLQTVHSE